MSNKGTVVAVDREQAVAAIAVEGRGYTMIELTSDWAIEVGDVLSWQDDGELGFEHYHNETRGVGDEVFVQNHDVPESEMRIQLALA